MARGNNINNPATFIDILEDSSVSEVRVSRKQRRKSQRKEHRKSKFKHLISRSVLLTLFIPLQIVSLVYMNYIFSHSMFLLLSAGLSLLCLLFFTLPVAISFPLFVLVSMGLGFYLVEDAWVHSWSFVLQYNAIRDHLVIMVFLVLTWFEAYFVRKFNNSLDTMTEELERLKKLNPAGILTKNEFLYRLEDLVVGMRRRNESGFVVVIRLDDSKTHAIKSIAPRVGQIVLRSVRTKYDLVGELGSSTTVVALQNTDVAGCTTVVNRIKDTSRSEMSGSILDIMSIDVIPLDELMAQGFFSATAEADQVSDRVRQVLGVHA